LVEVAQQPVQACVNGVIIAQKLVDEALEPLGIRVHDFSLAGERVARITLKDSKKTKPGKSPAPTPYGGVSFMPITMLLGSVVIRHRSLYQ
jgi:hypothetical protein